jgi:hypothetical protein
VNGSGSEELLFADDTDKIVRSWSPDGKYLLYQSVDTKGDFDIFALPLAPGAKPVPLVKTEFSEANPQFSPDGRWVAYQSDETGRGEIYLTPFPGPGGKHQVSLAGGLQPRWRADGRELFFVAPDGRLMAAEVALKPDTADFGAIHSLFGGFLFSGGYQYDVSADGQRILAVVSAEPTGAPEPLTLVQNWTLGLKK